MIRLTTTRPAEAVSRTKSEQLPLAAPYSDLQIAIEYLPLSAIEIYENNPRSHTQSQVEQIAASIQAFGFVGPLVVDTSGQLIAGHGRLAAATLLGLDVVPTVRLEHLNDAQKRALRIADNAIAANAGWSADLLKLEFQELLAIDLKLELPFDLSVTGFHAAAIDRLVDETARHDGDDDAVPEPDRTVQPVAQRGDVWVLGDHRILCGDARDPACYAALLGNERARMSISDPPYNLGWRAVSKSGRHSKFEMGTGEMTVPDFTQFLASFLTQARAVSPLGAIHFAFMDWRHMGEMLAAGQAAGLELKNLCVWAKSSAGMGGGGYRSQHELAFMWKHPGAPHLDNAALGKYGRNRTNLWEFPGAAGLRRELQLHPTPKPVSLVAEAIRDVSNRNDLVLDCFSGSGTTIIAAAKTGRRARVIELDPHYVDVAITRWQDLSGGTAMHAVTGLSHAQAAEQRAVPPTTPAGPPDPPPVRDAAPTPPAQPRIRVRPRPQIAASV